MRLPWPWDHCIIRHLLRYYRHSDPVIYISKLPAPSASMPCKSRILQSPIKEQVKLVLWETVGRSHHIFNEWEIQYIGQIFDRQNKEDSSYPITILLKASTPNLRNLILQFTHNTFLSIYLTKNKGYTHPKISLHIPFWRLQLKSVQTTAEVCTDYTCSLHRLRRVLNFSARTQGSVCA